MRLSFPIDFIINLKSGFHAPRFPDSQKFVKQDFNHDTSSYEKDIITIVHAEYVVK